MPKKKILIVEDEREIREAMAEILSSYTVFLAKSGAEGIEIAKEQKPDLILSDIRMPGMTGLEMLQQLRKDEIFSSAIFITGFADTAKRDDAAMLGAFDFLEKPVKASKLLSVVKLAMMFGTKSISKLSGKTELNLKDTREFVDINIKNVPNSLLRRLQEYCSARDQNVEETIIKWLIEKLDQK